MHPARLPGGFRPSVLATWCREASGRLAVLADDATTLALGQPTPHALTLSRRQVSTRDTPGAPNTTRRPPSPLPRRPQTRGRRCLGQPLGMRLVGANWLSSRFTFVVCRPPTATCRGEIELQGIGRRQRRSCRTPGGRPTEVSIMNDRNETVNNSHCAGFAKLRPATLLVVLHSSAVGARALTGKLPRGRRGSSSGPRLGPWLACPPAAADRMCPVLPSLCGRLSRRCLDETTSDHVRP